MSDKPREQCIEWAGTIHFRETEDYVKKSADKINLLSSENAKLRAALETIAANKNKTLLMIPHSQDYCDGANADFIAQAEIANDALASTKESGAQAQPKPCPKCGKHFPENTGSSDYCRCTRAISRANEKSEGDKS